MASSVTAACRLNTYSDCRGSISSWLVETHGVCTSATSSRFCSADVFTWCCYWTSLCQSAVSYKPLTTLFEKEKRWVSWAGPGYWDSLKQCSCGEKESFYISANTVNLLWINKCYTQNLLVRVRGDLYVMLLCSAVIPPLSADVAADGSGNIGRSHPPVWPQEMFWEKPAL